MSSPVANKVNTVSGKYVPPHVRNRMAVTDATITASIRERNSQGVSNAPYKMRRNIEQKLTDDDFPSLGTAKNSKQSIPEINTEAPKKSAADLAKAWAKRDNEIREQHEKERRLQEEEEYKNRILYGYGQNHPRPVAHGIPYPGKITRQIAVSFDEDDDYNYDYDNTVYSPNTSTNINNFAGFELNTYSDDFVNKTYRR
jgi:hypothetical protein